MLISDSQNFDCIFRKYKNILTILTQTSPYEKNPENNFVLHIKPKVGDLKN